MAALLLVGCSNDPIRTIDALQSQGNTDAALRFAEKTLPRESPAGRVYWQVALRKAQLLEKLNRREEALGWILPLMASHVPPRDLAALLLRESASIETALGRFRDSDRHLLQAIDSARSSGQARMVAVLEVRRAYVLMQLDRLEDAEQCLAKAEEYARQHNDRSLDPYIWHYRGKVLSETNQFENAIAPLEESLRAFQGAKQPALAANVMISLAWCYFRLGRFDKALALYEEALMMADAEDRHLVLGHLGNMAYEQGEFTKAAEYYGRAAELAKGRKQDFEAKWLNNRATALIEQKRWAEAEQFNDEALELEQRIDSSEERATSLVNSGLIQTEKGNYPVAERILTQATGSRTNIAAALDANTALGNLYARIGKPKRAKTQFESALELADETGASLREDENKISYLSSLIDLHRGYVNFLMDSGDKAGAFAVAESSRARLLRERLNLPRSASGIHRLAEYQALARRSGATILAYWIGPERSYLWVISAQQFGSYPLPPEREVSGLVEQYQSSFEHGGAPRTGANSAGARLFQCLLAQHPGVVKPGRKYLIVPDGPLYALNFETLPVPGDPPHFWIEDATVVVAPSLDLLLARHVAERRDRSLLLIGDAVEWNSEFPKLLYARKEMDGIEKQFPEAYRKVLAGTDATPASYQRSQPAQYAYIHFAAHATANKNSPFDSSIILSQGKTGGKLSAKEVLSTPVNAELVTISACHSAGARTYWGEGLVGFAWAFLQSGAHDVIAGLWDVSDYSSPLLMQDLYAGLAASKNPADALRSAKLQLIRGGRYASAYYWGTFQLYQGVLDLR